MVERYSSARDLFEASRDAAKECRAARIQLERLESSRFGGSGSVAGGGRGGRHDVNGMGATIALVDFQELMRRRIADDTELMELATAVAYGEDGRGGVAALMGSGHADVLCWRYIAAETWERCARACNITRATAVRRAQEAFDVVDALGFERAIEGIGMAEED